MINIKSVSAASAPMDLLLQADPNEPKVREYLENGQCRVAVDTGSVVGAYVLKPNGDDEYELMSISVVPDRQQQGIGTQLLEHCISTARKLGAKRLDVCTGTFGYQLAYYQRAGFRVQEIIKDFFVTNYDEPIYENGIHLQDMLRLSLEFE